MAKTEPLPNSLTVDVVVDSNATVRADMRVPLLEDLMHGLKSEDEVVKSSSLNTVESLRQQVIDYKEQIVPELYRRIRELEEQLGTCKMILNWNEKLAKEQRRRYPK